MEKQTRKNAVVAAVALVGLVGIVGAQKILAPAPKVMAIDVRFLEDGRAIVDYRVPVRQGKGSRSSVTCPAPGVQTAPIVGEVSAPEANDLCAAVQAASTSATKSAVALSDLLTK